MHAAHVKNVPGRKTDQAAARWSAKLRRLGFLPARCLPPQGQRAVQAWIRYRTQRVQERGREGNRLQGVRERATMQLAAVVSDRMGGAGRARREALMAGQADPAPLADVAKRRRRSQFPLLEQALAGGVRDHPRPLLARPRAPVDFLDAPMAALTTTLETALRALRPDALPARRPRQRRAGRSRRGTEPR